MRRILCLREELNDPEAFCYCPTCRGTVPAIRVAALGVAVLVGLFLLTLYGCATHSAPQSPAPLAIDVTVQSTFGKALGGAHVWSQLHPTLKKETDGNGHAMLLVERFASGVCVEAEGYHSPGIASQKETCVPIAKSVRLVLEPFDPPYVPPQRLTTDRQIFRTADGKPFRWKGVSAFRLLDRFANGEDITPFLNAYQGYNLLRVWAYVEGAAWGGRDWPTPPSPEKTRAFLAFVGAKGWYVELTLLTDDKPARMAWAKAFVPQLVSGGCPANLLLEAGNEPRTHKAIDTAALRSTLQSSGCQYASGDYEDSTKAYGTYLVTHTKRDSEWPRRAHDCLDFYKGGGPNKPTDPAHPVPCIGDEPGKPADMTGGDKADDTRAYFGTLSLLGGGGTWHCESCKYGDLPTAEERMLALAALEGLNAYPADAPLGNYSRPVESSLRTYVVGQWMVRVRPKTDAPSGTWQRLGPSRIFWGKP